MSTGGSTLKALPRVPSNIDPELRQYLQQLHEVIETLIGLRGVDLKLDRAVTLRMLYDAAIIEVDSGINYDSCPTELQSDRPEIKLL